MRGEAGIVSYRGGLNVGAQPCLAVDQAHILALPSGWPVESDGVCCDLFWAASDWLGIERGFYLRAAKMSTLFLNRIIKSQCR